MPIESSGNLLAILRDGRARTRAELVELTGLARSTVSSRLDALMKEQWIVSREESITSGGRPATAFAINPTARVVLTADLDVDHAHLAVADLNATLLAERRVDLRIGDGPKPVLRRLSELLAALLPEAGHDLSDVCGVGVGLPGPVEHATGRPVSPPIMPGWNGFDVIGRLESALGTRVFVDNDVNIMTLGEHRALDGGADDLICVKHSEGIGSGIITGRRLHRGAQGAAGDIGHMRAGSRADHLICRCGNIGCLEALAGGAALAARLAALDSRDVVRLVQAGDSQAIRLVRQAGRDVGDSLASIVNFFNPCMIVVGGELSESGEHLLAGIREAVYNRSLPLATEHLQIRTSTLGDRAGVIGGAVMVIENVMAAPL